MLIATTSLPPSESDERHLFKDSDLSAFKFGESWTGPQF